jgi:hypothetical protein
MSPSAPLDLGSLNLSQFLSGISREGGPGGAGRSMSVGAASAAMAVAAVASPIPAEAAEVTDNIKSGETDPEKLSKLRIQPTIVPPIVAVAPMPVAMRARRANGGLYLAIVCGAIILLGLAVGVVLFLMQGR